MPYINRCNITSPESSNLIFNRQKNEIKPGMTRRLIDTFEKINNKPNQLNIESNLKQKSIITGSIFTTISAINSNRFAKATGNETNTVAGLSGVNDNTRKKGHNEPKKVQAPNKEASNAIKEIRHKFNQLNSDFNKRISDRNSACKISEHEIGYFCRTSMKAILELDNLEPKGVNEAQQKKVELLKDIHMFMDKLEGKESRTGKSPAPIKVGAAASGSSKINKNEKEINNIKINFEKLINEFNKEFPDKNTSSKITDQQKYYFDESSMRLILRLDRIETTKDNEIHQKKVELLRLLHLFDNELEKRTHQG